MKDESPSSSKKSWYSYGYFVVGNAGQLMPSGHDFGQTPDTYKVGDIKGIRDGVQAVVVRVEKGKFAKLGGFDVMVVLEERPLPRSGSA